ncbi:hypothetical protein KAX17_16505 [Candidatus Bipolaricaulota bacterium]|nr:hypothetical protein [Candidatus Bipolaricaulota bacterium]
MEAVVWGAGNSSLRDEVVNSSQPSAVSDQLETKEQAMQQQSARAENVRQLREILFL